MSVPLGTGQRSHAYETSRQYIGKELDATSMSEMASAPEERLLEAAGVLHTH